MITGVPERRTSRVLSVALLASLLLHVLVLVVFGFALVHKLLLSERGEDSVAVSTPITLMRREKVAPAPTAVPATAAPVVRAPVAPRVTVPAYEPLPAPRAHAVPRAALHPRRATDGALSEQQMTALNQAFDKTIAQERSALNPLNVPSAAPAAPKHYAVQIGGIHDSLRPGEGSGDPISRPWMRGPLRCYYMNYEYEFGDGTYENDDVPWPVCWLPKDDPFARAQLYGIRVFFAIPPPQPDYTLPANAVLKRYLRQYFPERYPNG